MFAIENPGIEDSQGVMTKEWFKEQSFQITYSDVDLDSGRNADGTMVRNYKGTKKSLEISMPPMSTEELHKLLRFVNVIVASNPYLAITHIDPRNGTKDTTHTKGSEAYQKNHFMVRGTFYVGDRTVPIYSQKLDIWNNISFTFVEK